MHTLDCLPTVEQVGSVSTNHKPNEQPVSGDKGSKIVTSLFSSQRVQLCDFQPSIVQVGSIIVHSVEYSCCKSACTLFTLIYSPQ